MDTAAGKLQYKENFDCLILNSPEAFNWPVGCDVQRKKTAYDFELLFVRSLEELIGLLPEFRENADDRLRWIAYPKRTGGIQSDLSRDIIWAELENIAFQPVAMVSLDSDWSAMRIRPDQFVKKKKPEKTGMPDELKKLLSDHPACRDYFSSLSRTNQKEYMHFISSAKRADTRSKRLQKTKMLLEDKIANPYASR